MDRVDYFKKKGSTVDAKFSRLHRRSIDQRTMRGRSFMDNRAIDGMSFSPVKEDNSKAESHMPPPTAAAPKANKASKAALPVVTETTSASSLRMEKLKKWKEEKELKRKQLASKTKPQVFRVSKAVEHKEDRNLFMTSQQSRAKSIAKPAAKSVVKSAPVTQRVTRSSTRAASKPPTHGVKDTSRTRAPPKKTEPAHSTRSKRGPPAPPAPAPTRTRPSRSTDRAASTRQSSRLASKQPTTQTKNGHTQTIGQSTRGKKGPISPAKNSHVSPAKNSHIPPVKSSHITPTKGAKENMEPTKPVIDTATFNVTNERGSSMLTDTFGHREFTFSMAVPDLPFTPISPASASIFLFPSGNSNTPSQRRCSTPYSLRPLKSLAQQANQEPIPPQPDLREQEDGSTETEPSDPVVTRSVVKSEAECVPTNENSIIPQEEVAMETENLPKEETLSGESVNSRTPMDSSESSSDQQVKDVPYFKNLVSSETTRLLERCSVWEKTMSESELSEEVCGEIRSAIGKAKLLIDQRFKQFLGLIKNCEFGLGEKVTNCSDLEGFWEMIYFQVEDVDVLFKDLAKLQANNWQKEEKKAVKPKVMKKKKPVANKSDGGEAAAKRKAARERLMAAKAAMQAKATRQTESEKVIFEGGFFKVESPARKATPAQNQEFCEDGLSRKALQNRTNFMSSPASALGSPALQKKSKLVGSPATTLCSPALKMMTLRSSPASSLCSPAGKKRTNAMASPAVTMCSPAVKKMMMGASPGPALCSPLRRKTRKSSMGFGLSQGASLFTPDCTPEKAVEVGDLIQWD